MKPVGVAQKGAAARGAWILALMAACGGTHLAPMRVPSPTQARAATPPRPPSPVETHAVAACETLRALEAYERADVSMPPGTADEGGPVTRVLHGRDECSIADDNLQKLEDSILAEDVPAAFLGGTASDRATAPRYLDWVDRRFFLSEAERAALRRNGFVVPERLAVESFGHAMQEVFQSQLPLFVSADALLDAVYAGNDRVIIALEQNRLKPSLDVLLAKLACALPTVSARWPAEVVRDVDLYVTVARLLRDSEGAEAEEAATPEDDGNGVAPRAPQGASDVDVDTEAAAIVRRLNRAEGLLGAPGAPPFVLFGRPRVVDASAYRPRGHYANPTLMLAGYFRAASWLSRLEFNLKSRSCKSSHPSVAPDPGETPREELDALALAELVDHANARADLDRLDAAWGLLAGAREDVSMADLGRLREKAAIGSLDEPDAAARLREAIGEGWARTARTHFMPEGASDLPVIATMLGARVVADAKATRFLVNDAVPGRWMVHAADMAYVLGNDRAKAYLAPDLKRWPALASGLDRAREEAAIAPRTDDLYGSWMDAVRGLAELPPPSAPSFMRTDAWRDLRLDSTVAAFGQLRHNYVLMATGTFDAYGCDIPDGWVEPVPATLDAIVDYAERGARNLAIIDPNDVTRAGAYFGRLKRIMSVLRRIVAREVAGGPLTEVERRFLGSVAEYVPRNEACVDSCAPPTYTGWWFDLFIDRVSDGTADPRFVADYYTSTNAGSVAYVGAGRPHLGIFVVDANGPARAMVGPVASAFDYAGSLARRLADSDVEELKDVSSPWAASYTVAAPPAPFRSFLRVARVVAKPPDELDLEVTSDRTLGAVTIDLLDHHRQPLAAQTQTRAVGRLPTRFPFAGALVARAEGLRVRVGAYVVFAPDRFDVDVTLTGQTPTSGTSARPD